MEGGILEKDGLQQLPGDSRIDPDRIVDDALGTDLLQDDDDGSGFRGSHILDRLDDLIQRNRQRRIDPVEDWHPSNRAPDFDAASYRQKT